MQQKKRSNWDRIYLHSVGEIRMINLPGRYFVSVRVANDVRRRVGFVAALLYPLGQSTNPTVLVLAGYCQ